MEYTSVKSFPSIEVEFNNITANSSRLHGSECNRINRSFENYNFYDSCTKITEFMKYLKSNPDSDSISENCNYLNYKINTELRRLKKVSDENSEFYDKILRDYKNEGYDLNTICKKKYIGYINNDVFDKINDIRDIYIHYNKFKSYARTSSGTNCEDINKCIELYTKHKVTCDNVNNKNFCVALDYFKNEYQAYIGQIIRTCESAKVSLESYINIMVGSQGEGEGTGDDLYGEAAEEREEQATDPVDIQNNSQMGQSKSNITIASSTILYKEKIKIQLVCTMKLFDLIIILVFNSMIQEILNLICNIILQELPNEHMQKKYITQIY
ncbi:hypothetical protein PVIIG_06497 [Plasmodium vivax India VII]|uniref:PIR Superfamily Protein n=1 Tax=Plasmodium vivax India VII TaxID=1077284 RepID=A0A0J9S2S1_PLAVI|nr:hypothetical protein PVIIG_06497 [Plasmodium vivax India VII]